MLLGRDRSSQNQDVVFRVPERIPIFPLPNLVFYPDTFLPLHIFELRYRAMVMDAVAGGQCIGMALLKDGWESDYYGNPPIFPLGCVGRLIRVEQLPDDRYNILLQGLERYEIRQEIFDKRYREAQIVLKPRQVAGAESSRAETLTPALREALRRAAAADVHPHRDQRLRQTLLEDRLSDERLVNSLSGYLDFTPLEQQFLLEAESLQQQARRLLDLLDLRHLDLAQGKGSRA
ncbi:MAG: LON peptidase substrate-binding domain-containing protein [Nitrospirales bacterium]